jgi:hypothetical protein
VVSFRSGVCPVQVPMGELNDLGSMEILILHHF